MPKKNNTGLIIGLVVGAFVLCCVGGIALFGMGIWAGFRAVQPVAECAIAFETARDAIKEYAADNDGKLPKAATWQDDIRPYVEKTSAEFKKSNMPFKVLEPDGAWGCSSEGKSTGMAFNADLSGKKIDAIPNASITPLLFEIPAPKRNAAMPYRKQDDSNKPKMMGKPREWAVLTLEGSLNLNVENSRSIKIETGSGSNK